MLQAIAWNIQHLWHTDKVVSMYKHISWIEVMCVCECVHLHVFESCIGRRLLLSITVNTLLPRFTVNKFVLTARETKTRYTMISNTAVSAIDWTKTATNVVILRYKLYGSFQTHFLFMVHRVNVLKTYFGKPPQLNDKQFVGNWRKHGVLWEEI